MPDTGTAPGARWRGAGIALALATAALAVVLRFWTTSALWLDESLSVNIASLPMGSIPEALRHDGHPPLYYLLLHGWISAFGGGDAAVRSLSGVFGVAALALAYPAGRRVGGHRAGLAALVVVGFSPFAVRYATETRMYSLVMALVLAGHLLVRRAVDERHADRRLLAGLAAVTGALLLTHYWSLYLGAGVVVVLAWWGRRGGTAERAVAVRLAAALAVGTVAFVPWLPSFLEQAGSTGTPWAGASRPTVVLFEMLRDFGGGVRAEAGLLRMVLVVLVLAGIFAEAGRDRGSDIAVHLGTAAGARGEAAVIALTMALGSLASLVTSSAFAPRYASVVFPLVALVVARGLSVLPGLVAPLAAGAVVALLGLAGIVGIARDDRTQAPEWAAALVAAGVDGSGGDVVVTCPDQLGPTTRRALDAVGLAEVPVLAYPTLGDGRFVDWTDYRERNDAAVPAEVAAAVVQRAEGGPIWIVSNPSYRTFEGDCEALVDAVQALRATPATIVVADGGGRAFEHGTLLVVP